MLPGAVSREQSVRLGALGQHDSQTPQTRPSLTQEVGHGRIARYIVLLHKETPHQVRSRAQATPKLSVLAPAPTSACPQLRAVSQRSTFPCIPAQLPASCNELRAGEKCGAFGTWPRYCAASFMDSFHLGNVSWQPAVPGTMACSLVARQHARLPTSPGGARHCTAATANSPYSGS